MNSLELQPNLIIQGIQEPIIVSYFQTINQQKFEQTAALFAPQGKLLAPFTKEIVGRSAIATYLAQEAKGMELLPQEGILELLAEDVQTIRVVGKVKTSLFSVSVAWNFVLSNQQEIIKVQIKLLASPQELLSLKSAKEGA